jgi:hypothetical protein
VNSATLGPMKMNQARNRWASASLPERASTASCPPKPSHACP